MNATENERIEALGLIKCDLNDACNFCNEPQNGVYSRMVGYDSAEIAYYICGKCALEKIKAGVAHCIEIEAPYKSRRQKLV